MGEPKMESGGKGARDDEQLEDLNSEAQAQSHKLHQGPFVRVQTRNMQQLLEQTEELRRKTERKTDGGVANVFNSQLFFASKNLDVSQFIKPEKLDKLKLPSSIDPPRRFGETNVDAFLKNERHNALDIAIVKAQKETRQEYHSQHLRKMMYDWEREKNALRELLGSGIDLAPAQQNYRGSDTSSAPFTSSAKAQSSMNQAQKQYTSVVWRWVGSTMDDSTYDLINGFHNESTQMDHVYKDSIADAWETIRSMTRLQSQTRQAQHVYLSDPFKMKPSESRDLWYKAQLHSSRSVLADHLSNAKRHLEERYAKRVVQRLLPDNQGAGPVPWYKQFVEALVHSTIPAVRIAFNDEAYHQYPTDGSAPESEERMWAHIYYCLRSGSVDASGGGALVAMEGLHVPTHVSESEKHKLRNALLNYGKFPYNRPSSPVAIPGAANARDFQRKGGRFKQWIYMVLGLCHADANMINAAAPTSSSEDWLWFKLNMVPKGSSEPNPPDDWLERGIKDLQRDIWEDTNEGEGFEPLLYFEMLMFTAQFERAIDFLRRKQMVIEAIHFAIPLEHVGLLRTMNKVGRPAEAAVPAINFGHMVQSYVRTFQESHIDWAMRYYYLLRNYLRSSETPMPEPGKTIAGNSLFVHCVTEMVMKTQEYSRVLGSYDQNGYKTPALVDEYEAAWSRETNLVGYNKRTIIRSVGQVAEMTGHLYDAVNLYDLADDQAQVLNLLNQKLSETASNRRSDQATEFTKFYNRAIQISQDMRYHNSDSTWKERDLLFSMLTIVEFFDLCHDNKPYDALSKIAELRDKHYIPSDGEPATNEACVLAFDQIPHEVLRNLPDMLLYTMHCLNQRFQEVKSNLQQARALDPGITTPSSMNGTSFQSSMYRNLDPRSDGGQSMSLQALRDHARNLVKFAGRINYRMPGDTNAKLIRMEVAMS